MSVPVTGRRVAIVAGVRTPFARSGTVLRDVPGVAHGPSCRARAPLPDGTRRERSSMR